MSVTVNSNIAATRLIPVNAHHTGRTLTKAVHFQPPIVQLHELWYELSNRYINSSLEEKLTLVTTLDM